MKMLIFEISKVRDQDHITGGAAHVDCEITHFFFFLI